MELVELESARQELEPVSRTAQWTAAARALESERPDRIFYDPYARLVAGEDGTALLRRYEGSGVIPFVLLRTRYLDDAILAADLRQVVLVGAGMDTRALRLPWPAGVTLYELDRPALLAAKRALLDHEDPAGCTCRRVPVDLAGQWREHLLAAGFNPGEPTLWVAEGLFFFLPEEAVRRLLATLRELSAPQSVLVGDLTSETTLKNPLARGFLSVLADDGNPWLFGTDEPERFLTSCGWTPRDLKQPGEDGADFGRWPYPVPPPGLTHAPRSFLFTAGVRQP
jgi:methyltransferase (TIGR00027 family)